MRGLILKARVREQLRVKALESVDLKDEKAPSCVYCLYLRGESEMIAVWEEEHWCSVGKRGLLGVCFRTTNKLSNTLYTFSAGFPNFKILA